MTILYGVKGKRPKEEQSKYESIFTAFHKNTSLFDHPVYPKLVLVYSSQQHLQMLSYFSFQLISTVGPPCTYT